MEKKIYDFHFHEHARNSDETGGFGCFGIRAPFTAQKHEGRKSSLPFFMKFFVYILFSSSLNRYYVGQTNDIASRLKRHNTGQEKYTSKGQPWQLQFYEEVSSRSEAIRIERKIKNFKSQRRIREYIDREIKEGRGCRGKENL